VFNVPVTSLYKGELITSVAALSEAIELGLVEDPVPDGTFVNMPVVLPEMPIEVMGSVATANQVTMLPTQVFGRGFKVDVFELGTSLGRQPLRPAIPPLIIGQSSGLQTGVATGTPPVKSTAIDAQPVFQFAIPTAPPTVFQYTPLVQDITLRLANGIAPSAITSDSDLFTRNANFAITGVRSDNVETFTVNTLTVNNIQLQYADGAL
jgi:hypothetical protein